MRGRPRARGVGRARRSRGPTRRTSARAHIREVLEEVVGHVEPVFEVPPGVDIDEFVPRPREEALAALVEEARRDPPNPGNANERLPDEGNADAARGVPRRRRADRRLLRQADREQGRAAAARGAARPRRARGDRRLRRLPRRARGAGRRSARSSPGRSSTGISSTCCRSPTLRSCRRSSPRRSAWSRPRLRPPAARRSSRGTPASPRSRPGSRRSTRSGCAHLAAFETGSVDDLRAKLRRAARAARGPTATRCAPPRARRRRDALVVAERRRAACSNRQSVFRAMGEEQRLSPEEQLAHRARRVRERHRLHGRRRGGVRAARPRDARARQPLRGAEGRGARAPSSTPHLVGELIASEVEVRTGKCADFGEAAARDGGAPRAAPGARARAGGRSSARPARIRGAAGRTSGSSTRRTTAETTRSSGTSSGATTPSGCTSTSASRGGDRAIAVHNALRSFLPELLALSASSPFVEEVDTGLHSARTQIFTRMFPRCGIPDALRRLAGLRGLRRASSTDTGSITEHTQLWWSVRPHLAYPDGRDPDLDAQPDLGEAQRLAALAYALAARCARAHRRGRAAAGPAAPAARGEHVARDPLRALGRADRLRARRAVPARARIEQLVEWVAPVAEEIGAAPYLAVPAQNAAERQRARTTRARRWRRSTPSRSRRVSGLADEADARAARGASSPSALRAARRSATFLLSTVSTLASIAYGKLERGARLDAGEGARSTRSARSMPVLEGRGRARGSKRDFEQALANLQELPTPTAVVLRL